MDKLEKEVARVSSLFAQYSEIEAYPPANGWGNSSSKNARYDLYCANSNKWFRTTGRALDEMVRRGAVSCLLGSEYFDHVVFNSRLS